MATLDATTAAEYAAEVTAAARSQVVIDALSDPVTVNAYNASDDLVGSGTMTSPWATVVDENVSVGTLNDFFTNRTEAITEGWYLKFESGSRSVRLSLGESGSGKEAIWSESTWLVGTRAGITTGEIVVAGSRTPVWNSAPDDLLFTQGVGGTQDFSAFVSSDDVITFSLVGTAYTGISINSASGLLTVSSSAVAATRALTVRATGADGLYADHLVTLTISAVTSTNLIAGDDWDTFPLGPLADGYSYPKFGGTIRHSLSGYATGTGVASPWASVCVASPRYGSSGRAFAFYIPGNTSPPGEFRCQHELSNFEGYPSTVIEGREIWAGFAIRLDSAFPYPSEGYPFFFGAHAAVGQYDGSPWGIRFAATGATQWRFSMEQAGTGTLTNDLGDYAADRGQWVRWVIHMKYSLIGQGWAKVWKNGVQVVNRLNISTLHPTCTQTPYIKWGIYNDRMRYYASLDERITLDAIRIAGASGSYALVAPETYL